MKTLHKLFFAFTALLFPFMGEAIIVETAHVADAIPYIDEDTWFLVDLDNTMFQAKQALGHANWFYDIVGEKMQKGMTRDEAIRDWYPNWIKTQPICPVVAIEEDFIPALIALQNRGIVVMGLTHRQPTIAEATLGQVASLGFDYLKTAPYKDTISIPSAHPTLYTQGVLFVGDYNKKGDILIPFLSLIRQSPKKVVFIDDKRKNVEELEHALSQYGIEYVGIYYTAIEHAQPVYSRELADYQYKFLNKIMGNEAAALLMEHQVE